MTVENTLNKQQKIAVHYNGGAQNVLVIAGAGCGKTRTIISRAAHLIKSGIDPSRILLVTFTILFHWWNQSNQISACKRRVGTFKNSQKFTR